VKRNIETPQIIKTVVRICDVCGAEETYEQRTYKEELCFSSCIVCGKDMCPSCKKTAKIECHNHGEWLTYECEDCVSIFKLYQAALDGLSAKCEESRQNFERLWCEVTDLCKKRFAKIQEGQQK
jgi:hypothetical protein